MLLEFLGKAEIFSVFPVRSNNKRFCHLCTRGPGQKQLKVGNYLLVVLVVTSPVLWHSWSRMNDRKGKIASNQTPPLSPLPFSPTSFHLSCVWENILPDTKHLGDFSTEANAWQYQTLPWGLRSPRCLEHGRIGIQT